MLPLWERYVRIRVSDNAAASDAKRNDMLSLIRDVPRERIRLLNGEILYGKWRVVYLAVSNVTTNRLAFNDTTIPPIFHM